MVQQVGPLRGTINTSTASEGHSGAVAQTRHGAGEEQVAKRHQRMHQSVPGMVSATIRNRRRRMCACCTNRFLHNTQAQCRVGTTKAGAGINRTALEHAIILRAADAAQRYCFRRNGRVANNCDYVRELLTARLFLEPGCTAPAPTKPQFAGGVATSESSEASIDGQPSGSIQPSNAVKQCAAATTKRSNQVCFGIKAPTAQPSFGWRARSAEKGRVPPSCPNH